MWEQGGSDENEPVILSSLEVAIRIGLPVRRQRYISLAKLERGSEIRNGY